MKRLNTLGLWLPLLFAFPGCFGSTGSANSQGGLAGEGRVCTGIDPSSVTNPKPELTVELGQGRTKIEFQPHLDEDRLELSQGAQGMTMIVYDLQVRSSNLTGNNVCATIVTTNAFSLLSSDDYLPKNRLAYVLERDEGDFFAGPIYHPFGWELPSEYETERFNVTLKVFVGDKTGMVQREFQLLASE